MRALNFLFTITFTATLSAIVISFLGYEVHNAFLYIIGGGACAFIVAHSLEKGLGPYLFKRILQSSLTLFAIASLTFCLLRVIPGGPFDTERALPPEIKASIEAKYKLDAPIYVQYLDYFSGLLRGELGQSFKYVGRDVSEIIKDSFPVSFELGVYALVITFLIGIIGGVLAAAYHNTWVDRGIMLFTVITTTVPSFTIAAFAISILCVKWGLFPVAMWDGPEYYVLPMIILGLRPAAAIARLTRSNVLDVIRSDYIRTARAKGLDEMTVLFKHVLKNSLIPVLTYAGPLVAGILSGAFVIEHIFNIPGMAKHFIQSVTNRDYPLVMALTLVFSTLLVIANLIVDILYTYFDPRIKLT
jgi:oligopeptide transport system permease protein